MRLATTAAPLLLAVSIAAGCGESAAHQFRDSLSPLQQQAQARRSQIAATLQAVTLNDRRAASVLDQEIGALAGVFDRITKLRAPSPAAQSALVRYDAANGALVVALRRVAQQVAQGSSQRLQVASAGATDAAGAVQRASDALDAALGR